MKIRIVLSGRGYDVAESVPEALELPEGAAVADVLLAVNERLPEDRPLPTACLIAVAGVHLGTVSRHREQELHDGDEVVLIAPVAGG